MNNKTTIIFFNGLLGVSLLIICTFFSCKPDRLQNEYSRKIDFDPTKKLHFRPNIVWLVAEDLSPIIPTFGDSTVDTPNLNRLADEGVRYTNVYSPSGVCAPSRCALTTGMYPSSIGAHNMRVQYVKSHMDKIGLQLYEVVPPPEVKMMSQIMRENGYYCTNNDKQDYQFTPPVTAWDESSLTAHWRNRPSGKPFFAVFNFDVTHEGHVMSPYRKQILRYTMEGFPDDIDNLNSYKELITADAWDLNIPEDHPIPIPPYLPETEVVKSDVRRVYSNIIEMDRQVGVILQQLESDRLLDSTVVVWYTDNGGPLPRQKRLIYDSGIKIPMIIRFPGMAGRRMYDDRLISFVDFAPTTFSLASIPIPSYIQGQAFLGKYRAKSERNYIHAAADRLDAQYDMKRAVKDKQYKYLRYFYPDRPLYLPVQYRERMPCMQELLRLNAEGKLNEYQSLWFRDSKPEEELFDTWVDPHELHNLAEYPAYISKLEELRLECERWMDEINDMGLIPESEILEMFWPDGIQPVTMNPEYEVIKGSLILSCETEGASIGYRITEKDKEKVESWIVYTEGILIKEDMTIEFLAHRLGFAPSEAIKLSFQ